MSLTDNDISDSFMNPINICLKFPNKLHPDLTIENHEKLNILTKNKSYDFDGIFCDEESKFEDFFLKDFMHKNLCKVLEGFDCHYLINETMDKSIKSMEFYSVLLANLKLLNNILQDLQKNQITYLIKCSFFISQEKRYVKDIFEELEVPNNDCSPQIPNNKYFIDYNDLLNLVSYKLSNLDFEKCGLSSSKNFQICFKLELFLYNNVEKICWKGKLLIIDQCVKSMSFALISPFLSNFIENYQNSPRPNGNESQISHFLSEEKGLKDGIFNLYLKYKEINIESLEFECENFTHFRNQERQIKQNPSNNIQEYISMILDLQKRVYMKDYDLYNKNMSLFLKEKELDEYKLKIAQLESYLYYKNVQEEKLQNISIVDPNFEEPENQDESEQQDICPERSQTLVNEESFPKFFRSLSNYVNPLQQMLWDKKFNSANYLPLDDKTENNIEKEIKYPDDNEGEQLLQINYYEELTMLRTKFQKVNKELMKKSCENEKMLKLLDKLKEQKTMFSGILNLEESKTEDSEKNSLLESLKKKEEEISELKKLLWEKNIIDKNGYSSETLKYYYGDAEKMKAIIARKIKDIVEEQDNSKKEKFYLEVEKMIEIMFNQYYCKSKTNEELLKELNEIYVYYYRRKKQFKK